MFTIDKERNEHDIAHTNVDKKNMGPPIRFHTVREIEPVALPMARLPARTMGIESGRARYVGNKGFPLAVKGDKGITPNA